MWSPKFTFLFSLLATFYILPFYAKPTDLVSKLAKLALEPENDVRFNEVYDFDKTSMQHEQQSDLDHRFKTIDESTGASAADAAKTLSQAVEQQIARQALTSFSTMMRVMGSVFKVFN